MQSITVPYRITKRQSVASLEHLPYALSYTPYAEGLTPSALEQLLAEVQGYGGGSCYDSRDILTCGEYVICPDMPPKVRQEL